MATNSFETTFIWDLFIWDHIRLRPHSFETTFIWDRIHLRPHSFETAFIWDRIHLRLHSFETTFIWDYIHLRPHSFYPMLKWICFDLLCITFNDLPFTFFAEDLKFSKVTIHLKFCKVAPFRVQGWLTLVCKCTRTQGRIKGESGGNWPGPLTPRGHPVMILFVLNKILLWKIVIRKRYKNTNLYSDVAVSRSTSIDFSTILTCCQFL